MRGSNAVLAALGLSVALTVTACGSSGTGAAPTAAGSASTPAAGAPAPAAAPSTSAPAAAAPTGAPAPAPAGPSRVLGKAELQAALVATGDLNGYTMMEMPMEIGKAVLSTRPADCQPIEGIRTGKIKPDPAAYVITGAAAGSSPTALTQIMLASIDGDGAHQVLAALKSALTTCTGYEGSIPKRGTVAALPAPALGEEAVSYTLTSDGQAQELTVVRLGSVVAVFSPSTVPGGGPAKTPQELVARQLDKIRTTAG
ncbi:hypothetical protein [Kitasatospora sp. NPDC057223]|uniref:hypothetical protein n=1 Tax=Kitasatospora sp. NPDC057223 TaxID=3346055 RepID=UPI003645730A